MSKPLRAGVRLSAASIVWTLASSTVSIGVGVTSHSLVLIAFGLTGLLDAAGSIALLLHFSHAIRNGEFSAKYERISFVVVNTGLIVVALVTVGESAHRLVSGGHSKSTVAGIVVAGSSVVVLGVLSLYKRRVGDAIPSAALKADSVLSANGAALGVVTIIGAALTDAGIEWADPVAAAVVGVAALSIGVVLRVKNEKPQDE